MLVQFGRVLREHDATNLLDVWRAQNCSDDESPSVHAGFSDHAESRSANLRQDATSATIARDDHDARRCVIEMHNLMRVFLLDYLFR